MKNVFLLNKRVLIFILVGLILIDLTFSSSIKHKFTHPEGQRLPSYDEATLKLWLSQINSSRDFNVVVLGDSVIHGYAVKNGFDTMPAYIARELFDRIPEKNIRVFNMGMAGAGPADVFFLLNALNDSHVNLVIYNINVSWFASENTLNHKDLLRLSKTSTDLDCENLGLTPEPESPFIGKWFHENIFNLWKFNRYKILLNYWLFGKPLREKLQDAKKDPVMLLPFAEDQNAEALETRVPWYTKKWDDKLDPSQGRVGAFSLNNANRQWPFYQMILETIKNKKIPALFFVTPHNYELLERYDMIDKTAYVKNLSIIVSETQKYNITVLDYDKAVPYDLFTDMVHLLPKGNEILAQKMIADIFQNDCIKRYLE